MIRFLLFISLFASFNLLAQNIEVTNISHYNGELNFPILSSETNKAIPFINADLQKRVLDKIIRNENEAFNQVAEEDEGNRFGIVWMKYIITYPKENVITLNFKFESVGAYLYSWTKIYSYDLVNGIPIQLDQILVNEQAKELFCQHVELKKDEKIKLFLSQLDTNESIGKNQWELYQDCLISSCYECCPDVSVGKEGLQTITEHCANHANRALDDLYDFKFTFTPEELAILTNDYGKWILGIEGAKPDLQKIQIFKGMIDDKYPITLMVSSNFNGKQGYYYYDKYKKPIFLSIDQSDDVLVLYEIQNGKNIAHFDLKLDGSFLTGTWIEYNSGKELSVSLKK